MTREAAPANRAMRDLSAGAAARLLGVSHSSLLLSTAKGRLRCWTTPGGHRRYERVELLRFAREVLGRTDLEVAP
jgi:DNA-binding transcriptional MerR regulator